MDYDVIINPELGGKDLGNNYNNMYDKDYNLKFSKLLSKKLKDNNINNFLIRTDDKYLSNKDRINIIDDINRDSNSPIIITIGLGNNLIDIIYGLNNKDNLASIISEEFVKNGFIVNKYYQQRDSINTEEDYESIIRDTPNNESIIIRLGNMKNNAYLNDNIEQLVDSLVNGLKKYLGASDNIYIVKKGDNLYSIARKYNVTIDEIKRINNLYNNNLSIGQQIKIPQNNNYYIVKNGDTLYSISRKYNVSVDNIKKTNKLLNNNIYIGQKILIPNEDNIITYKVMKGDTLYNISKKYNVSVKDIMNINNLSKTTLQINQILKIPKNNI